ncbi:MULTISPECIES: GntR family transcriptional regulator [unclassified Streptomyces]|uniref:GntR family transcriptional regulator n=1 Tax=unclassified Streptomyces TaxID=2593676 RepID=UPI00073B92C5|nr:MULTISPECIES: GntR family transcriptional regulator [unclassified Streptomyces]ODA72858.1 putative HTH-type transcriptional regulator YdfH [Streptomyces sp. AVP053U2]
MDSTVYTRPDAVPADPAGPLTLVAPVAPGVTPPAGSLRDRVYAELRAAVLDGGFGTRERLSDVRLAARFGVSRTPVREALARLLADGLIERGDGGFHVTVLGLAQLKDLYELRVTLELRGIARAIEDPSVRHDPAVLGAELERWYAMRERSPAPDPRFVVQDERFHAELSRASGNPALTDALVAVGERIRRVRRYDFLTEDRVRTTVAEHIEIMELVRDGRLDEAYRALHAHVGDSMDVVLERARRAMTQRALHADDHP